jgi:hypothetical protein
VSNRDRDQYLGVGQRGFRQAAYFARARRIVGEYTNPDEARHGPGRVA